MQTIEHNLRKKIVSEALSLVGERARNHPRDNEDHSFGCSPETGFDCSGLVVYVLGMVGLTVPQNIRHTSELFDRLGIFAHRGREGDLVFFSNKGLAPKHIGIMINNREFVHSPGKDNTKVAVAELKIKRVPIRYENQLYLINPIGFKVLSESNGRWQKLIE